MRYLILTPAALLVLLISPAAALRADDSKFEPLLQGDDLSGWVVEGKKEYKEDGESKPVWSLNDGVLRCAGKGGGFLRYDEELCDFVLRLEYRMSEGCNSGVGIRGVEYTGKRETRPSMAGYELQILDDANRDPHKHGSMSLYRYLAPTANAVRPAGEWNRVEITCRGPHIRVTLNGETVQDLNQKEHDQIKDKPLCGYISVQNHGKEIEFRKIELKRLGGK